MSLSLKLCGPSQMNTFNPLLLPWLLLSLGLALPFLLPRTLFPFILSVSLSLVNILLCLRHTLLQEAFSNPSYRPRLGWISFLSGLLSYHSHCIYQLPCNIFIFFSFLCPIRSGNSDPYLCYSWLYPQGYNRVWHICEMNMWPLIIFFSNMKIEFH